jgi:hypothetical protein
VKRNSLSFVCQHLQSVAIANNCNSFTLYSAAVNTINKKATTSNKNMDIERFFCSFLSLSLSIDTFSSLSSDQHSRLFLHYTPSSYQHQFKQKKKCSACKERISLFMLSIAYNTHSRYSGICLLGNVVSGKTYRQLSEQASEQKEEESKKDRMTTFLTQV